MTRRLRVAQVVTRFMAGAGGVALRGAQALDPAGYEVVFVTGSGGRLIGQAGEAGFEVIVLPALRSEIAPADDRRALTGLRACLGAGGFDVVHTHSSKAGVLGRIAARRAGVGTIVHTFHGFPFHQFQSRARRMAYIRIEQAVGRFTDVFLATGQAVAAEAIAKRIAPPERIRTIGVAVDTSPPRGAGDRAEARRLLGVPPGAQVVGTVGRLDFQKAPEDFVAALAGLDRPDVFGVWIGDGPLRARTEKLAARSRLSGRLSFAGERSDVAALLPGLDIFAMASRYEGLPCAIVEAMVAGLPVVATTVNSVPNIVIAGETGLLVPPGRPELLGRALGYLLGNPAAAARLGAAGPGRPRPAAHAGRARGCAVRRVPGRQETAPPGVPVSSGTGRAVTAAHQAAAVTAAPPRDGGPRPVPFCRTEITLEAQRAALRVLAGGWVTMGAESVEFEREFAAWVGAPHAVAVSSCTAAIEMALMALRLPGGAPVLTPTLTFCGAIQAIIHAGLRPVLVDTDEATLAVSADGVARAARRGAAAMVIQHMAGYPLDAADLAAAAGLRRPRRRGRRPRAGRRRPRRAGGQRLARGVLQLLRHQEPADRRGRCDHHHRR